MVRVFKPASLPTSSPSNTAQATNSSGYKVPSVPPAKFHQRASVPQQKIAGEGRLQLSLKERLRNESMDAPPAPAKVVAPGGAVTMTDTAGISAHLEHLEKTIEMATTAWREFPPQQHPELAAKVLPLLAQLKSQLAKTKAEVARQKSAVHRLGANARGPQFPAHDATAALPARQPAVHDADAIHGCAPVPGPLPGPAADPVPGPIQSTTAAPIPSTTAAPIPGANPEAISSPTAQAEKQVAATNKKQQDMIEHQKEMHEAQMAQEMMMGSFQRFSQLVQTFSQMATAQTSALCNSMLDGEKAINELLKKGGSMQSSAIGN